MIDPLKALAERRDGQREWLRRQYPEVFEQQKHLDADSVERAYWHYGYMVALSDVLRLLQKTKDSAS